MQFFTALLIPTGIFCGVGWPLPSAGAIAEQRSIRLAHLFTRLALPPGLNLAHDIFLYIQKDCCGDRVIQPNCCVIKSAVASSSTGKSSCTPG